MTISQLQKFFSYEDREEECIDDILTLIKEQKQNLSNQIEELKKDYEHILRKYTYYKDIKNSLENGDPRPSWSEYRNRKIGISKYINAKNCPPE